VTWSMPTGVAVTDACATSATLSAAAAAWLGMDVALATMAAPSAPSCCGGPDENDRAPARAARS